MLKEFRAFVLRGNVVDLAIGVVIGAAFGRIIDAVTKGLITPVVTLAGTGLLEERFFCVGRTIVASGDTATCAIAGPFRWGQVLDEMISFVLLAAVLFFFVVKPVNHLMERLKPEEPREETTRECPECLSRIPRRARRCMFCTAPVPSL